MNQFWQYIRESFPSVKLRHLHTTLAILVIFQILESNGMHFSHQGIPCGDFFEILSLWLHIICGILATICLVIISHHMIVEQSLRQFFPYFWGDTKIILKDVKSLLHFHLPDTQPKGLANTVQGLGIVSLWLVVISGMLWLILWTQNSAYSNDLRKIHETLTSLVEAYIIAHGSFALLHFWINRSRYDK